MPLSAAEFNQRLPRLERGLRRFVATRVYDDDRVSDVVQTALARASARLSTLRRAESLEPWLRRIALNEINRMYRERKPVSLAAAPEAVAAVSDADPARVLERLDAILGPIAAVSDDPMHQLSLLLFFGLNWSAAEIASLLNTKPVTIYKRVHRAKQALKQAAGSAHFVGAERALMQTLNLANSLFNFAAGGVVDAAAPNAALMQVAYELMRMLELQHPGEPRVQVNLMQAAYLLASRDQPGVAAGDARLEEWRPETWDEDFRSAAEAHYRRCLTLSPPPGARLLADFTHALYSPRTAAERDWPRLLELSRQWLRQMPSSRHAVMRIAQCLFTLEGPRPAAEFLESQLVRRPFRHAQVLLELAAFCHAEAGDWRSARRHARALLKLPLLPGRKRKTTALLQRCEDEMRGNS